METDRLDISLAPAIVRVAAGTVIYPPGGRHGPRKQKDLQLVLLHTGSMDITIDEIKHTVPPGNVALLKPGHHEYFQFSVEQETWHRWISISLNELPASSLAILETMPLFLPISEEMNHLTDILLATKTTASVQGALNRMLGLSALLLYESETRTQALSRAVHPSVVLAKQAIHRRYMEDLSLEQLSHVSNITPEHLIRLFHIYEKRTPIQYLWSYRVRRGVELLCGSGLMVSEVAERCGFKTSYHFSRMIKRQTNKTPSQIRNESWSGRQEMIQ
jgi:AraC-like DNA-binding protein